MILKIILWGVMYYLFDSDSTDAVKLNNTWVILIK